MREIKFCGRRIDNKQWVYGYYHFDASWGYGTHYITLKENLDMHKVDPETVGQYTGLPDENGKDIYEKNRFQHEKDIGTVVFRNGMYCVEWDAPSTWGKETLLWKLHDGGRIIPENPDLLEA
ncbi:YopX family protein [Paenibacillus filicis]|uniref:YopX family protein n=1 Tax=Paenibacillus filicis TaxID=669464 RepID=A0ABU9DRB7_9BACL